jgi:uncharacterized membrane protein YqgA involved in biofilm formation
MVCGYKNKKEMPVEERVRDILFPTSGGSIGSILTINMDSVTDTIIYAAIGAIVGYLIKLSFDCLMDWFKKRRHDKHKKT